MKFKDLPGSYLQKHFSRIGFFENKNTEHVSEKIIWVASHFLTNIRRLFSSHLTKQFFNLLDLFLKFCGDLETWSAFTCQT